MVARRKHGRVARGGLGIWPPIAAAKFKGGRISPHMESNILRGLGE